MAPGGVVWITGLPAAGKTTLALALAAALRQRGRAVLVLDGDRLRAGVGRGLDWSPAGRREQARRAAEVALLAAEQGQLAVCALVSPCAADRAAARRIIGAERFLEVHVDTAIAVCRARDPHGLYARAAAGRLAGLAGVDTPYEAPARAALAWDGARPVASGVEALLALLEDWPRVSRRRGTRRGSVRR